MNAPCIGKLVLTKPLIFYSFFNCQRQNKDHYAHVNCGGVEFLKLREAHIRLEKQKEKKI
jgi:hypothetical protein